MTMKSIALSLILLAISSHLKGEEIRYIRDELYVPLRSGQSMQHRIVHKGLVSGTPVTLLESNTDNTYSLVRTRKGIEGWIQTQYLSNEKAGRDLYKEASKKLTALQQQNAMLAKQLSEIKNTNRKLEKNIAALSSKGNNLNKELSRIKEISANAIQLNTDNQRILEENQMLKNKVEMLTTDNKRLNDAKENDAFLNGAFAVVIGVMITLLVPRLWPRKTTEWA